MNILKPVLNSRSATVLERGVPCSTKRLHKKVANQVHSKASGTFADTGHTTLAAKGTV